MTRFAGLCALSLGLLASACGVGNDPTPPAMCSGSACGDMLGRVCGATMSITGSYVQSMPPPLNADGTPWQGCWPVGMWTFSAQIAMNDCQMSPTLLSQYQFRADSSLDADGNVQETFTYVTDPTANNIVKVSEDAAGCEGQLDLYSADGLQQWTLHPHMNVGQTTLDGQGEYWLYTTDQWVQP
jgi:hypothetical protein